MKKVEEQRQSKEILGSRASGCGRRAVSSFLHAAFPFITRMYVNEWSVASAWFLEASRESIDVEGFDLLISFEKAKITKSCVSLHRWKRNAGRNFSFFVENGIGFRDAVSRMFMSKRKEAESHSFEAKSFHFTNVLFCFEKIKATFKVGCRFCF